MWEKVKMAKQYQQNSIIHYKKESDKVGRDLSFKKRGRPKKW
jgi:hypothetical protein